MIVSPKELSPGELERMSRGYIQKIWREIGSDKDVPAPDVYTNPTIMGWMRDEFEKLIGKKDPGVITGKAIADGGSEGRETATAQGGVYCVRELAKKKGLKPSETTVAVQGLGNVGGYMAKLLTKDGYKIVALSDSKGGVYNQDGVDPDKAEEIKSRRNARLLLFRRCLRFGRNAKDGPCKHVIEDIAGIRKNLVSEPKKESEPQRPPEGVKLGEILVIKGDVSEEQLEVALKEQSKHLGEILVEKGATTPEK